jgi:hypothetical protein
MNFPTQLRKTEVEGCTVSSIKTDFAYETRIFLNGMEVEGLVDHEEVDTDWDWKVNHDLAIAKIIDCLT